MRNAKGMATLSQVAEIVLAVPVKMRIDSEAKRANPQNKSSHRKGEVLAAMMLFPALSSATIALLPISVVPFNVPFL